MKNFIPTTEMISVAQTAFKAVAYRKTIEEIVIGYQTEILKKYQFQDEVLRKFQNSTTIITDPRQANHMKDEDFVLFLTECNQARIQSGLVVDDPDQCPLLVAEHMERDAKRNLINCMKPFTNISSSKALNSGLKNYDLLVDLILKLFANYFTVHNIKIEY